LARNQDNVSEWSVVSVS